LDPRLETRESRHVNLRLCPHLPLVLSLLGELYLLPPLVMSGSIFLPVWLPLQVHTWRTLGQCPTLRIGRRLHLKKDLR